MANASWLWRSNRVLGPSDGECSSITWDALCFAGPVVVRVPFPEREIADETAGKSIGHRVPPKQAWRMYYYGRGKEVWNMGVVPFNASLPTGNIGMALNDEELRAGGGDVGGRPFTRYKGPHADGAILHPSDDPSAFDCVHIGLGDVVQNPVSGMWHMYYFGGSMEEMPLPGMQGASARGARFRPGLALSSDGIKFKRQADNTPLLDVGPPGSWDENGVSWPRVLAPHRSHDHHWLMSYHTRESGAFFSAGIATSSDGMNWAKVGRVLSRGEPGSWDEGGVSVRHIVRYGDRYLMFYEGSNSKFEFAIGLAVSEDGMVWERDTECGPEPGGPVLRARKGEDVWDNWVVGTPYVVVMPDDSLRMYYLGVGKTSENVVKNGIGMATSDGRDFRRWRRVPSEIQGVAQANVPAVGDGRN